METKIHQDRVYTLSFTEKKCKSLQLKDTGNQNDLETCELLEK